MAFAPSAAGRDAGCAGVLAGTKAAGTHLTAHAIHAAAAFHAQFGESWARAGRARGPGLA